MGVSRSVKEDRAIMQMSNSIGMMTYYTLYDKFGFGAVKLQNFYGHYLALRQEWSNDQVPTEGMLKYCAEKKIDAYGFMKSIPMRIKLMLCGLKNATPTMMYYIEPAFLTNILMTVIILKEQYKFSNAKIEEYLHWMGYWIDSYTRKQPRTNIYYLNDKMIVDTLIDEIKLDLVTGKRVA